MEHIILPIPQLVFKDLQLTEYINLFSDTNILKGAAVTDIAVFEHDNYSNLFRKSHKSGAGFLSFLSSIAKKSLPYIKNIIFPEALNLTSSLIEKTRNNSNKPLKKEEIKKLAKESIRNIAKKTLDSSGGSRKKRKKRRKIKKSKKRRKRRLSIKKKLKRNKTKNVSNFTQKHLKRKRKGKLAKHAIFTTV